MELKKYFSIFNIKEQVIELIDSYNIRPEELITAEEKKEAALNLINVVSRLNGAIALQPLPIADILLLTPIQVSLVVKIARIYNRNTDFKLIKEVVATVLKGVIARTFTRTVLKFIPFFSAPVCMIMSYTVTNAIGRTAIKVFENDENFDSMTVREIFNREFNKVQEPLNIVVNTTVSISQDNLEKIISRFGFKSLNKLDEDIKNILFFIPHNN